MAKKLIRIGGKLWTRDGKIAANRHCYTSCCCADTPPDSLTVRLQCAHFDDEIVLDYRPNEYSFCDCPTNWYSEDKTANANPWYYLSAALYQDGGFGIAGHFMRWPWDPDPGLIELQPVSFVNYNLGAHPRLCNDIAVEGDVLDTSGLITVHVSVYVTA